MTLKFDFHWMMFHGLNLRSTIEVQILTNIDDDPFIGKIAYL